MSAPETLTWGPGYLGDAAIMEDAVRLGWPDDDDYLPRLKAQGALDEDADQGPSSEYDFLSSDAAREACEWLHDNGHRVRMDFE